MTSIKTMIKNTLAKLWILKNIKNLKENKYFFCSVGIGDILFVLTYLDAIKKAHKDDNRKLIFIIKKSHKQVVDMYSKYVDDVIVVKPLVFKLLNYYIMTNVGKQNKIFFAHPCQLMPKPTKLLGVKNICLLDFYKVLFEIPYDSKMIRPTVDLKNKNRLIKQYQLEDKKAILLCPYCASIPTETVDMSLWDKIADKYLKLGYKVYTNIKDETESVIKNTMPLNLNLMDFYSIIENFEHVYSMRSGLCDLMAFSKVNLTVVYPCDSNGETSSSYLQFNFKNIGIRNDIEEVILSKNNNLLELVDKNIKNK